MSDTAKILLVDDEPGMLRYIRTLLEVDGHKVDTASTGEEAVERIQKGLHPDLVLLDLLMPGTSGWDVLEFMEERPRLSTIPVVVLTAYGSSGEIPTGRPVIHKPVDPDLLLQLVEELLSQGDDARKFGAQEGPSDLLPRSRRGLPPRPT